MICDGLNDVSHCFRISISARRPIPSESHSSCRMCGELGSGTCEDTICHQSILWRRPDILDRCEKSAPDGTAHHQHGRRTCSAGEPTPSVTHRRSFEYASCCDWFLIFLLVFVFLMCRAFCIAFGWLPVIIDVV